MRICLGFGSVFFFPPKLHKTANFLADVNLSCKWKVSQLSLLHKDSKAPLVTSGYSAPCVNSGDEGQNTAREAEI